MRLLAGGHYDARPTQRERRIVQTWLDIGAPYPGTYAALGTGSIGGYINNTETLNNDRDWPETQAAQPVFARRCASCHEPRTNPIARSLSDEAGLSFWEPRCATSAGVLAAHHLQPVASGEVARAAGPVGPQRRRLWDLRGRKGRAAGRGAQGSLALRERGRGCGDDGVFPSTADPDYRLLLAMCRGRQARLEELKRFDMPGFKPREEYVREMKRFGLLAGVVRPKQAASGCIRDWTGGTGIRSYTGRLGFILPISRASREGKELSCRSTPAAIPLQEDLVSDLIGIVATGQTDEQLAVLQAKVPNLSIGMARPTYRQQHRCYVLAGHMILELSRRFMLAGGNQDQFLKRKADFRASQA